MKESQFLKLLSIPDLVLEPLDGKRTIAQSGDTFDSYLDFDFKNWGLDSPSKKTLKTPVHVYEMTQNSKFSKMLELFADDLDQFCLTQHQIISFCEKYPNHLRQEGYATFFLFKEKDEYFVAGVRMDYGSLEVRVHRFEFGYVWGADDRHRVVVPQLNLES